MNSNTTEALKIGTTLQAKGKYQIVEVLGHGGFGITYLAVFNLLQRKVAIKEYFPHKLCKREENDVNPLPQFSQYYSSFRTKFLDEAKQLAQFKYDHIVDITDFFEENNTAYFVMEYIEGVTLHDYVIQNGCLDENNSLEFINQIGNALELIHDKDILHRDIKPKNIVIDNEGKATLIDFGAAREIVDTNIEHTAIFSEGFAPPEQYEKTGKKGPHIDVYGLGATLYYCLTGQIPISARLRESHDLKGPFEINPFVSKELSAIVMKSMEMNLNGRYPNISKFLYQLNTISPLRYREETFQLTESQKEAAKIFNEFLSDDDTNVLILTGSLNTGKSKLIIKLFEIAQSKNYFQKVLTVGSRLAERLRVENGYSVNSIYSTIYDLNYEAIPKSESKLDDVEVEFDDSSENEIQKFSYPMKLNDDADETIYIIDDAQLLSDFQIDDDFQMFGSGKLLTDFIGYAQCRERKKRKIVFVGDEKELTRGKKDDSSLFVSHLEDVFEMKVKYYKLSEVIKKAVPACLINQGLKVFSKIEEGLFNELIFQDDNSGIFKISTESFNKHYLSHDIGEDKIFIGFSNKQIFEANKIIRNLLGRKESIEVGDRIIFNNTINILLNDLPHRIYAGEFGVVTEISPLAEVFEQPIRNKGTITLNFRKISVTFPRRRLNSSLIISENYLNSESKELPQEERLAITIRAKKHFREKFPSEKLYRHNLRYLLKSDEYFNTGLVKYAYALTCHRAQSLKWNNIFLDCETDQGKENEEYFRWIYTAFKCARKRIYLLNSPEITPFSNLSLVDNSRAFDEYMTMPSNNSLSQVEITNEIKHQAVTFGIDNQNTLALKLFSIFFNTIKNLNVTIDKIDHHKFQEVYYFKSKTGVKTKIAFYYNSSGEITRKICSPQNDLSNQLLEVLNFSRGDFGDLFEKEYLKKFYERFGTILKNENIIINNVFSHHSHFEFQLIRIKEIMIANIFFKQDGFITTVWPTKYNSKALLVDLRNAIDKLKDQYGRH